MKLQQHPLSAAFPAMPADELDALKADVATHGQIEPGFLYDGMVLDGWHRYQACEAAGIEFEAIEWTGDPVAFVISRNAHRRHLTASQRAAAIVTCSAWRESGCTDAQAGRNPVPTLTESEMAAAAGVTDRTIRQAKEAVRAGLGEVVRDGKVSAKRAAEIAKLPEQERESAVNEPVARPAPADKPAKAAETDRLKARIAELEAALQEAREAAEDAGALAQDLTAIAGGDAAKRMGQLEAELKAVKVVRDQYMRENAQLKRQIKGLERKLGVAA